MQRGGLAGVVDDEFDLATAIGGWRGMLEAALPTALFVVVFTAGGSIAWASGAAVATAAVLILVRVLARQSVSQALGGLFAVALGAVWALTTDRSSDFYAPGLLYNAAYALLVLGSIVIGRPLVGVVVALLVPQLRSWRELPAARRTYRNASWVLFALFASKFTVQGLLWLEDRTVALGIAKIAMGLPLFALTMFVIWRMHHGLMGRLDDEHPEERPSVP